MTRTNPRPKKPTTIGKSMEVACVLVSLFLLLMVLASQCLDAFADTLPLPAHVVISDDKGKVILAPDTKGFWTDTRIIDGCLVCAEGLKDCAAKRTECEKARGQPSRENTKIFGLAGAGLLLGVLIGALAGGR